MVATGPGTWQAVRAGPSTFPRAGGFQHMTETIRHFPGSIRAAVVAALLVLLSVVATAAGAAPPSKEDVQRAKHRLHVIEDALGRIQGQLASTQLRLNGAVADVEDQQIA